MNEIPIQLWASDKHVITLKNTEDLKYLPRIGEEIGAGNLIFHVKGIVHYYGSDQLNKPHIRIYVKQLK